MKVPVISISHRISAAEAHRAGSTSKLYDHHKAHELKLDERTNEYLFVRKVPLSHLNFTCVVTAPWGEDVQQSFPWLN